MKIEKRNQTASATAEPIDKTAKDDYILDDQVGFLFRCAHQRSSAIFQDQFSGLQLTPPQFGALIKIRSFGSVSQNSLARATAMDVATMQGVVCRLVDRGLIDRNPDPDDKRRLLITLTGEGETLMNSTLDHARAVTRKVLAPLKEDEREVFLGLLKRLL